MGIGTGRVGAHRAPTHTAMAVVIWHGSDGVIVRQYCSSNATKIPQQTRSNVRYYFKLVQEFLKGKNNMYGANVITTGGYIAGMVYCALVLQCIVLLFYSLLYSRALVISVLRSRFIRLWCIVLSWYSVLCSRAIMLLCYHALVIQCIVLTFYQVMMYCALVVQFIVLWLYRVF